MKVIRVTLKEAENILNKFAEENPNKKTHLTILQYNLGAYHSFIIGDIEYKI